MFHFAKRDAPRLLSGSYCVAGQAAIDPYTALESPMILLVTRQVSFDCQIKELFGYVHKGVGARLSTVLVSTFCCSLDLRLPLSLAVLRMRSTAAMTALQEFDLQMQHAITSLRFAF